MKIDVAVQSYRKPELLLYTLLSLKAHSAHLIDTVWINDDGSDDWVVSFYDSPIFTQLLDPWKVRVRRNSHRMGWWFWPVVKKYPLYLSVSKRIMHSLRCFLKARRFSAERENIRYQWAIDNTDKNYLFIIHDDVFFKGDVLGVYIKYMRSLQGLVSIIGDLGQCWRCGYKNECTPELLESGNVPDPIWPVDTVSKSNAWPCRVNEWCCLLNVTTAKMIEKKHHVLFGNFDNGGDIGAYWFYLAHNEGYNFGDPLARREQREMYYVHADGGSGHSVWVDQGNGKKIYDSKLIREMLESEFNFKWPLDN